MLTANELPRESESSPIGLGAAPSICPEPGLYPGTPAEVYFAWEAASNSRLMDLARSPSHCRHAIDNPEEPTPALIVGDAAHLCILQPELFPLRYVVADKCCARKKDGGQCGNPGKWLIGNDWFCGVHVKSDRYDAAMIVAVDKFITEGFRVIRDSDGCVFLKLNRHIVRVANHDADYQTRRWMIARQVQEIRVDLPPHGNDDPRRVLSQADYGRCEYMRDAVWAHPGARDLLNMREETELSAVWDCPETQARCKLRTDIYCPSIVSDLKTTDDASRTRFMQTVNRFGYHFQLSHYSCGLAALNRPVSDCCIIAAEKEPPFGVAVYRIRDDVLDAARATVIERLRLYKQCSDGGEWPCYGESIQDIGISDWALAQLERPTGLEA